MVRAVKARRYDASARQAQSAETRRRILEVARELVVERGYRGATVAAIARGAGVHPDTVYELVGRKPVILRELVEQAISGTDRAVAAEERDYVRAIRAAPDPAEKIAIYAAAVRTIQARLAPLFVALRDASTTEPEAQVLWSEISARRAENMRRFVRDLRDAGGLRDGLGVAEAADTVWALNSSEVYVLLVHERGWSPARYERWLADTWRRVLLTEV